MATPPNRDAPVIRSVQAIIQLSRKDLKIDGYWGTFTNEAYANAPASDKLRIDAILAANNTDAPALFRTTRILKRSKDKDYVIAKAQARAERGNIMATGQQTDVGAWVSADRMKQIIAQVAALTKIEVSTLSKFLDLEQGPPKLHQGVPSYNAWIVNGGGYSGLFQFDRKGAAWQTASQIIALPPFEPNWRNPFYNTLAAAAYLLANTKTIRRAGYQGIITGNIAYLMHNQGATGAWRIISGKMSSAGKQSLAANTVIADARREALTQRALA